MADDVQTNLRLPGDLKDRLVAAAAENGRSLSAEAAFRLEKTFSPPAASDQEISLLAKHWNAELARHLLEAHQLRLKLKAYAAVVVEWAFILHKGDEIDTAELEQWFNRAAEEVTAHKGESDGPSIAAEFVEAQIALNKAVAAAADAQGKSGEPPSSPPGRPAKASAVELLRQLGKVQPIR